MLDRYLLYLSFLRIFYFIFQPFIICFYLACFYSNVSTIISIILYFTLYLGGVFAIGLR